MGVSSGATCRPSYAVDQLERPADAIRDPLVFKAAFPLLGVLLVAYFVTAPFAVPVSVVTCAGALVLLALAGRWLQGGRAASSICARC